MNNRFFIGALFAFFVIVSVPLSANVGGVNVTIEKADKVGTVHIPLVEKRLDVNADIFSIGFMHAGKKTASLIEPQLYYVVTLKDERNKGSLHAIVKGAYMLRRDYRLSVLTEVVYRLSKKYLGKGYDEQALESRLKELSQKMVIKKGFVFDNEFEIAYSDVLTYSDKVKVLKKPYSDIALLQQKIKDNTLSDSDAYQFVYDEKSLTSPHREKEVGHKKVKPLYRLVVFLHVPKNLPIGSEITHLKQLRAGSAKVESFKILADSVPFRISPNGVVRLSRELKERSYSFKAVAQTKDGESNNIDFTIIVDKVKNNSYLKLSQ